MFLYVGSTEPELAPLFTYKHQLFSASFPSHISSNQDLDCDADASEDLNVRAACIHAVGKFRVENRCHSIIVCVYKELICRSRRCSV